MIHPFALFSVLLALVAAVPAAAAGPPVVGPIPAELRQRLGLDPFHQKYLDVDGLPVLGSSRVSDDAMAEAAWIVRRMLEGRGDILAAMAAQKVRVVVMAHDEYTTDIPEHAFLRPKLFWDRRARGLGATLQAPAVSGAEENLLGYRRDPYPDENIFLHEFAHAIHDTGMNRVDPTFDGRLKVAYDKAIAQGLWKNAYAATNRHEYWAEGVQDWFDDNAQHNDVRTRDALKKYDPDLAALCLEVFGDRPWRYVKPRDRAPEDRVHLARYDPEDVPEFHWRSTAPGDRARVVVQTAAGDFEVEIDVARAPAAARDFLLIALDGGYHSGRFVRLGAGAIRAEPEPRWERKWSGELALETVEPVPGAKFGEGDVVLVRDGGRWLGFAILAGEAPVQAEFAPVGRVVSGREVVRKILDAAPVGIRRVIRER